MSNAVTFRPRRASSFGVVAEPGADLQRASADVVLVEPRGRVAALERALCQLACPAPIHGVTLRALVVHRTSALKGRDGAKMMFTEQVGFIYPPYTAYR